MKVIRNIMLLAALLCVSSAEARIAKGTKKEKTPKQVIERPKKVKSTSAFLFGYAISLRDSTVFLSAVQKLDSVYIDTRTGFLMDRPMYSMQYQAYLEDSLHLSNMTTAVMFHKKKKTLDKKYAKVTNRAKEDPTLRLTVLDANAFKFYAERWIDTSMNVTDDVVADKDSTKKGTKRKTEKTGKKE